MTEVSQFHILSHIFISLIGGTLLLILWFNIRRRFKHILEEDNYSQKRVDKGLLYLSLSVFTWVFSGFWLFSKEYIGIEDPRLIKFGTHLASIVNNMFLLLALFYFYYAPKFIYNNKKTINKILIVIIATSIVTLLLSVFFKEKLPANNIQYSAIPDLSLSTFLSYLLGVSLYRTFAHRGLKIIGILSVFIILLMLGSQLSEVFLTFGNNSTNNLIKIIAKTSLISIFLVLATTWVIRLANMPKPNEMTIHFLDWGLVKISIPTKNVFDKTIDFGSKTTQYKNLLKFAIRRKYSNGDSQSIIVGKSGEITNQTYLTRIIENMNTILQLEDIQELERRDIFTFIGESRYRLRMIPDHITIDETLLEEFSKTSENQNYKSYCNLL